MDRKTIKASNERYGHITGVGSKYGLIAKDNDIDNINIFEIIDLLGEYEDIGMTPKEIKDKLNINN